MKLKSGEELQLTRWDKETILEALTSKKDKQKENHGRDLFTWAAEQLEDMDDQSISIRSQLSRLLNLNPSSANIERRRDRLGPKSRERLEKLLGETIEEVLGRHLWFQTTTMLHDVGKTCSQMVEEMDGVDDRVNAAGMATMYDPAHRLPRDERVRLLRKDPSSALFFTSRQYGKVGCRIEGYSLQVALKEKYFQQALEGKYAEHQFAIDQVVKIRPDVALDLYVFDVVLAPEYVVGGAGPGFRVLRMLRRELARWKDGGIRIRNIAGTASSKFGLRLAKHFGMAEKGRYFDTSANGTVVVGKVN